MILAERLAATRQALTGAGLLPLAGHPVLEVGCGTGGELARLLELGASSSDLHGVDLQEERVLAGREAQPGLDLQVAGGDALPFADAVFDLLLAITLFSSVLDDALAERVAAEMLRVLRPGGAVLWYDLRVDTPANSNVRGLGPHRIARLFPGCRRKLRRLTLLPPLARRLGPLASVLYGPLAAVPALRSHLFGLILKPAEAA
jgi:ubiquinone/menaquinone biosynthesis C-methylase UbiE